MTTIWSLINTRRFGALFVTQFLTSFNDNFYKNSLIALLTYGVVSGGWLQDNREHGIFLAGALFILPYFLCSASSGVLAERIEKTRIVRAVKIFECLMMLVAAYAFINHWFWLLFVIMFLLGVHSAVFSPVKYGILPTYLREDELVLGNALIEAATFAAIILGTIAGTQVVLLPNGHWWAGILLCIIAVVGYFTALLMPKASPLDKTPVRISLWRDTRQVLATLRQQPKMFQYILASTWFWFVSAIMMTLFPLLVSDVLHMNKDVYTVLLVLFALGVGVGSMTCAALLKGRITAKYTPWASLGMAGAALAIGLLAKQIETVLPAGALETWSFFLWQTPHAWLFMMVMFMVSFFGGLYAVPFFALLQNEALPHQKSLMFGANNIVNAIGMVGAVGYVAIMSALSVPIPYILLSMAGFCVVGAAVLFKLVYAR